MPIPLAFTKLLRSFESCAEAVEKLVIFRKGPPPPHTNIFYIPNIKALVVLEVSDMKVFHVFPRWASEKQVTTGWAHFVPQDHNLNILGRGQLGDVT